MFASIHHPMFDIDNKMGVVMPGFGMLKMES